MAASEPNNPPAILGQALLDAIRQAVKEAMQEANGNGKTAELLTPRISPTGSKFHCHGFTSSPARATSLPTD